MIITYTLYSVRMGNVRFINIYKHIWILNHIYISYLSYLYTVHCTMYSVQCTVYSVHSIECTVYSIYTVYYTQYIVYYTLYTISMYSVYSVHVHCTLYTVYTPIGVYLACVSRDYHVTITWLSYTMYCNIYRCLKNYNYNK